RSRMSFLLPACAARPPACLCRMPTVSSDWPCLPLPTGVTEIWNSRFLGPAKPCRGTSDRNGYGWSTRYPRPRRERSSGSACASYSRSNDMRICRYNRNRIGIVEGEGVLDITDLFDLQPVWPVPQGDWIIRQMTPVLPKVSAHIRKQKPLPLGSVRLDSPVANPGKIIGAPINYRAHIGEANADKAINHGKTFTAMDQYGFFIKANSALIGPGEEVQLRFADRRNDHEVELAVIIGKEARFVTREQALEHVF